jgi:phage FluMu protein Com
MNTPNKTALDYDYEIIAIHERINRLLPITQYEDECPELKELADLYKSLETLTQARKEISNWQFPNYSELITQSKDGRERVKGLLEKDNTYDTRYVRTNMFKDVQFYRAYVRLTKKCPKFAF